MNVRGRNAACRNSQQCLRTGLLLWMLLLLPAGNGCSSTPKVDWDSRVGSFTHDQAVIELGPPDRTAELADGSRVSEWYLKRNSSVAVGFGVGSYGHHGGVGVGQTVTGGGSGRYLQLTFGADGLLQRWAQVNR